MTNPSGMRSRTERDTMRGKRSGAKGPSILVVDDHHMIADTLVDVLNGAGFHATVAYDGTAALRVAKELRPNYLLTDVVMPAMNGVELAIEIRKELPATKILLLSGQAGIEDILLRARSQSYDFELIAKPIHPEKLIDHLQKLREHSS